MSLRRALTDLLLLDDRTFRTRLPAFLDENGLDAERPDRAVADGSPDDATAAVAGLDDPTPLERELVWRVRVLDDVPFGLTLSGPAYEDNPIRYANRTFRRLSGYSMAELRGENPRLLQGPETAAGPVADLREALDIWEPVTVTLRNYRKDGTPFRNRVSLVPLEDDTGTVTNWIGIQEAIDD
ncbi:PAS domain-containing protein [Salinigranum marinum]|uniref:PAS domain-containing protein n=1 Tax=Salinigranum marinum TaxID=1515595 RepID=UPI002989CC6B|nr:PAS domain-containing protein [Salinigranum marinum]